MTIYASGDRKESLGKFVVHKENGRWVVEAGQFLLPVVEYLDVPRKTACGYFSNHGYVTILREFQKSEKR